MNTNNLGRPLVDLYPGKRIDADPDPRLYFEIDPGPGREFGLGDFEYLQHFVEFKFRFFYPQP